MPIFINKLLHLCGCHAMCITVPRVLIRIEPTTRAGLFPKLSMMPTMPRICYPARDLCMSTGLDAKVSVYSACDYDWLRRGTMSIP